MNSGMNKTDGRWEQRCQGPWGERDERWPPPPSACAPAPVASASLWPTACSPPGSSIRGIQWWEPEPSQAWAEVAGAIGAGGHRAPGVPKASGQTSRPWYRWVASCELKAPVSHCWSCGHPCSRRTGQCSARHPRGRHSLFTSAGAPPLCSQTGSYSRSLTGVWSSRRITCEAARKVWI